MSFNIIAESNKKLDYTKLHRKLYREGLGITFVPMPGLGIQGGDAIGISVSAKNIDEKTWKELKTALRTLQFRFGCEMHDLYAGRKLGLFNMGTFKKSMFQK